MRFVALLLTFTVTVSCKPKDTTIHDFQMLVYKRIPKNYAYNNLRIFYGGNYFLLKYTQEFSSGKIVAAEINHPEGIVSYSKDELLADSVLFSDMGFTKEKNIIINSKIVNDGGKKLAISAIQKDSVFCANNDSLVIYKVKTLTNEH